VKQEYKASQENAAKLANRGLRDRKEIRDPPESVVKPANRE
jgi:hypothetical protein